MWAHHTTLELQPHQRGFLNIFFTLGKHKAILGYAWYCISAHTLKVDVPMSLILTIKVKVKYDSSWFFLPTWCSEKHLFVEMDPLVSPGPQMTTISKYPLLTPFVHVRRVTNKFSFKSWNWGYFCYYSLTEPILSNL